MRKLLDTREGRIGCALAGAMAAAPFLALVFGWNAALVVLAVATLATSWLAWDGSRVAEPSRRPSLLMSAGMNLVFALIAIAMLIARNT